MPFDIVIVTHESAERMPACLEALRAFFDLDGDDRLWVVDNASRDGSAELVASLDPRARVIRNAENVGFARAVNQAVALGEAPYVALVNPDISLVTGERATLETLLEGGGVAAVAARMVGDDRSLQRSCHRFPSPWSILGENLALHRRLAPLGLGRRYRMLDWDMTTGREVEDACGGFLALSRAVIDRVGPFDERFFMYYEETDWLKRARVAGYPALFTPAIEAVHSGGGSSDEVPSGLLHLLLIESGYRYLRKWYGRGTELGMRALLGLLDVLRAATFPLGASGRRRAREAWRRLRVHTGGEARDG